MFVLSKRVLLLREFTGIFFERCNGSGALVLSPGGGQVQIYIDGLRMTGRTGNAGKDPLTPNSARSCGW